MKDSALKRKLVDIYEKYYEFRRIAVLRTKYRLHIMSPIRTIKYIKKHNCSISRFGDGEFSLMVGIDLGFQSNINDISEKLKETLSQKNDNLLLCLPRCMNTFRGFKDKPREYWTVWGRENSKHIKTVNMIKENSIKGYVFGDAQITRPYIDWKTTKRAEKLFPLIKSLWENKSVIIVEGTQTRLGVGNDLFEKATSIKRILAPAKNAYERYDDIKEAILKLYGGEIVVLALGPTASILAAELSRFDIQALDVGHIDVEYEWYLSGAKEKTAIVGKYVNEVKDGKAFTNCNDKAYIKQIVYKID